MAIGINQRPMSSFTRDLRQFETGFYEKASQEPGVSGYLKTKAIGPLVTFGVSLILHAEAVCRAVIICFLSIKNSFSQTNEELLETQRKECSIAYSESLAAFFSIFSKYVPTATEPQKGEKKLQEEIVQQPAPPAAPLMRHQPLMAAPPAREAAFEDDPEMVHVDGERDVPEEDRFHHVGEADAELPLAAAPALHEDGDEGVVVDMPAPPAVVAVGAVNAAALADEGELVELPPAAAPLAEERPPLQPQPAALPAGAINAAALADEGELVELPHAAAPLAEAGAREQEEPAAPAPLPAGAVADLHIDDGVLVEREQSPVPAAANRAELAAAAMLADLDDDGSDTSDGSFEHVEEHTPLARAVILRAAAPDPLLYDAAPVQDPFARGAAAGAAEDEQAAIRREEFAKETRILRLEEVTAAMREAIVQASAEVDVGAKRKPYSAGLETDKDDPSWRISQGLLEAYRVGTCQYTEPERNMPAVIITDYLTLKTPDGQIFAPLFGIIDPQKGIEGAEFLSATLRPTLEHFVKAYNPREITQDGIFNAISQAIQKLNSRFITEHRQFADRGASMGILLMIGGYAWAIQLGDVTIAIDNDGKPIKMSKTLNPAFPEYRERIIKLGGQVDAQGRINGKLGMATVFGRGDLEGAVSGKPLILQFPLKYLKPGSHLIIANYGVSQGASTKELVEWTHRQKETAAPDLAHGVVHSVYDPRDPRHLACLILRPTPNERP